MILDRFSERFLKIWVDIMATNSIEHSRKNSSASVSARQTLTLLTPDEVSESSIQFWIIDVQNPRYLTHRLPVAQRLTEAQILCDIPKAQLILLTCLVGDRSLKMGYRLLRLGYRQIYVLQGGIVAWRNAGYRLERYSP